MGWRFRRSKKERNCCKKMQYLSAATSAIQPFLCFSVRVLNAELTAEEVWEKRRCHFVPVERGTAEFLSKSARFVDKGVEGRFRRFPFLTITSALISCLSVDVNQRVHHNVCLAKMIISQRKGVIVMNFPYSTI